jgi:hypothetical protein
VNEKGSVHQSFTKEDVSAVIMMNNCFNNVLGDYWEACLVFFLCDDWTNHILSHMTYNLRPELIHVLYMLFVHVLQGAVLLILWSGCHADVPRKYFPPKGILPDLPEGGT